MSSNRTPAKTIALLREAIAERTGSDPVLYSSSPEGTAADRRYIWRDHYASGAYVELTRGNLATISHLGLILAYLITTEGR